MSSATPPFVRLLIILPLLLVGLTLLSKQVDRTVTKLDHARLHIGTETVRVSARPTGAQTLRDSVNGQAERLHLRCTDQDGRVLSDRVIPTPPDRAKVERGGPRWNADIAIGTDELLGVHRCRITDGRKQVMHVSIRNRR